MKLTRAEVVSRIDRFHTVSDKQKLAILDFLDAVPRAQRSWFKRNGWVMDPVAERARLTYGRAQALFVAAEREYWKCHAPGDVPDQSAMADELAPTNRAFEKPIKAPKPRAIDYSEARKQLQPYATMAGYEKDAARMLGVIALREQRYRDAIRYLEKLGSRASGLLASAHLALGDRAAVIRVLTPDPRRGPVPPDEGFLAELDGKRETAISHYVVGLDEHWPTTWQAYCAFRLKRLSVSAATIKRLKAEREAASNAGKILVATVEDFHAKFEQIAEAVRTSEKITAPKKPMTQTAIDKLRLPTLRHGKSPLVPVPRSMATILRYDRDFRLFGSAQPLLSPGKPVDIDKLVRTSLRIKSRGPVWSNDKTLPACIGLSNPGDQRVFLYMGTPDEHGEYPVARFDDQPELWISAASLIHHVLDAASAVVHCTVDFKVRLAAAKKRNKQHREALDKHVDVEALFDD